MSLEARDPAQYQQKLASIADGLLADIEAHNKQLRLWKGDAVECFKKAGLASLLVESYAKGKLSVKAVDDTIDRFLGELRSGSTDPDTVKKAILVFDGVAQRLSLAKGAQGFDYSSLSLHPNRARDRLITFARALHR